MSLNSNSFEFPVGLSIRAVLTYEDLSSHLCVSLKAFGTWYLSGHWSMSSILMSIETATAPLKIVKVSNVDNQ